MSKLTIEFEPLQGWGAQIEWATVTADGAVPGLRLNRLPVFRTANTGAITFGMPLLQGELPGSRYSGIAFDTDEHRQRFLARLKAALRTAYPELFDREAGE
jgi:hypothetical protein